MVTTTSLITEGNTAGATVTTTNSGLSVVSMGTGAVGQYASDKVAHGTISVKLSNLVVNSTAILGQAFTADPSVAQRVYFAFDALPTTTSTTLVQYRHSPDSSAQGITLNTLGHLVAASAETSTGKYTGSYTLLTNTMYRLETGQTLAAGTGRLWIKLFIGDSTTTVDSYDSGTTLTNNTVQANFGSARAGKLTNTAVMSNLWIDDYVIVSGSAAEIGPVSSAVANLHVGSGTPSTVRLGATAASALYLGATKVFG